MRHAFSLLLGVVLCAALPSVALGKDREEDRLSAEAKIHLRAGILHFQRGAYTAAEAEMQEAFRLRPLPELLFDLAQCYERLDRLDKAIEAYQNYLAGRPQAVDRDLLLRRIAHLRERQRAPGSESLGGQAHHGAPGEPAPAGGVKPGVEPPPENVVFKTLIVYREKPPKAGRGVRYAALATATLGMVGLGSAIGFHIVSAQVASDIDSAKTSFLSGISPATKDALVSARCDGGLVATADQPFCALLKPAQDAQRATFTAAIVGYSVAGAAAIGTTVLLLYGRHLDRRQERELARRDELAVVPTLLPGGGGLLLAGTF